MKTLKKSLSFVLVLALVLGMTVSAFAAAAFSDDTAIAKKEAVAVLTAIDVIDGFTDGTFGPAKGLNRGQACAFIARLVLGRTEADKMKAVSAPFKDVAADSTFAGYIAWCQGEGFIDGYADGTFKATYPLTTVAFGKMLLGALGYKSENEGFTGANWKNNVQKLMVSEGLTTNLDATYDATCAREEAAQLMLNALQALVVTYPAGNVTVQAGGATVTVGASAAQKIAVYVGATVDHYLTFMEDKYAKLALTSASGTGTYGRPSDVTWTFDDVEVYTGSRDTNLKKAYTTKQTKGTLYTLIGEDLYKKVSNSAVAFNAYLNGESIGTYTDFFVKDSTADITGAGVGTQVEVYVNSKVTTAGVTIAMYDYFADKLGADVAADAKEVTVGGKTAKIADFPALKGAKKNDWFVYTVSGDKLVTVEKAETVTGTITGYKDASYVKLDGTTYTYNKGVSGAGSLTLKDDAKLVLAPTGYVLYVDAIEADPAYVYIKLFKNEDVFNAENKVAAAAYFLDGSYAKIYVKGATTSSPAGFYTYTVKDDVYTLKAVEGVGNTASASVVTGNAIRFANTLDANNATKFLVRDDDNKIVSYTGYKALPSYEGTVSVAAVVSSGFAKYVFIDADAVEEKATSTSAKEYVFVYSNDKKLIDGEYVEAKALVDGKDTALNLDETIKNTAVGLYESPKYETKTNYVTGLTPVSTTCAIATSGAITYSNGVLEITSDLAKTSVADDCKFYVIKGTTVKTPDAAGFKDAVKAYDAAGKTEQIWVITNTDGVITQVYVLCNQ